MKIKSRQIITGAAAIAVFGAVVSPVIASAATADTTVNAVVGSTITITTSGTVTINLTPTSGGVVSSASDTVTVNTNNTAGYILTLADQDTNTSLVNGSDTIAAHTGTQAAATALATNSWGYAVGGVDDFDPSYSAETDNGSSTSNWAGVPSSAAPNTIKTTAATATNDVTTVWYGVKVDSSKPNGTYSDIVTYTATTN